MNPNDFKTDTIVKITGGRQPLAKFETWKYWEIVGELIWRGIDRIKAIDTTKKIMKAEPGTEIRIGQDIILKVKKKG